MKISLIIATIGRYDELDYFFKSLVGQNYKDFEIIVVDQNEEGYLTPLLSQYSKEFEIIHLRSKPGLSKARNIGIPAATGQIIGFPDDDCFYDSKTLFGINEIFSSNALIGVLKAVHSPPESCCEGKDVSINYLRQVSNRFSLMLGQWISFVIFFKREIIEKVGGFDENMGVGAESVYNSGEETDYLLRALDSGARLYSCNTVQVYHPVDYDTENLPKSLKKANRYGLGRYYLLKKHKFGPLFKFVNIVYPIFKTLVKGDFHRLDIALSASLGRMGIVRN